MRRLDPQLPARRGLVVYQLVLIILALVVLVAAVTCYRRRSVTVLPGTSVHPSGAPSPRGGGPLDMPTKPQPKEITFQGCPPVGDNPRVGDLNLWKNRVDEGQYRAVPIDSVLALKWPSTVERHFPAQWTGADRAAIDKYNGIPIAVEGYLAGAKESGPESPNCHGADHAFQDWHVWLSPTPGPDRTRAVVVETTPRVRPDHPSWTLAALRKLSRDGTRVRISGWLMMDPEHPDQIGKTRGTIWEIHPVMKIEVQGPGGWTSLDDLRRTR